MKKIKCGDANPKGNISIFFKGGCGKELEIKDAYRCTGCGGFFHLDCIFKHFELEEDHDYARNALHKLKDYIGENGNHCDPEKLNKLVNEGLDRKPDKKRLNI